MIIIIEVGECAKRSGVLSSVLCIKEEKAA
jgi:hypothetical protein